jgi:hypothetical protein
MIATGTTDLPSNGDHDWTQQTFRYLYRLLGSIIDYSLMPGDFEPPEMHEHPASENLPSSSSDDESGAPSDNDSGGSNDVPPGSSSASMPMGAFPHLRATHGSPPPPIPQLPPGLMVNLLVAAPPNSPLAPVPLAPAAGPGSPPAPVPLAPADPTGSFAFSADGSIPSSPSYMEASEPEHPDGCPCPDCWDPEPSVSITLGSVDTPTYSAGPAPSAATAFTADYSDTDSGAESSATHLGLLP